MINNVIDSIESPQTTHQPIQQVVLDAAALLGYSGGNSWETFGPFQQARPDLDKLNRVIPVTLSCTMFGHCYDIEPGGGSNRNIGVFMHNAKNVWKTQERWGLQWLYTFASNVAAMIEAARSFGYEQGRDYYILAAHPNTRFGAHICSPKVCGFPMSDGTQYLFHGDYDESLLDDYMLHAPKPPEQESDLIAAARSHSGTLHVFWVDTDKKTVRYRYQRSAETGWNHGGVFATSSKDIVGLSAETSATGTLEVFAVTSDGEPYHTWQSANSSAWNGGVEGHQVAQFTPLP